MRVMGLRLKVSVNVAGQWCFAPEMTLKTDARVTEQVLDKQPRSHH